MSRPASAPAQILLGLALLGIFAVLALVVCILVTLGTALLVAKLNG